MAMMLKIFIEIMGIGILIIVVMFIAAFVGIEIYGYKVFFEDGKVVENRQLTVEYYGPDSNFNGFTNAFTSVFIVFESENWSNVFIEHSRAYPVTSAFFFMILLLVG